MKRLSLHCPQFLTRLIKKRSARFTWFATLAFIGFCLAVIITAPIPSFDEARLATHTSEAQLLDRHGVVLQRLRIDPKQRLLEWIPLEAISPALVRSAITAEDQRFYYHPGIDFIGLGAALIDNIKRARPRGASTITMQLATLLNEPGSPQPREKSIGDKFQQIRHALALELRWSKQQILEAYLNRVTFRGELVGVAAASHGLLGKGAHGLDSADSAILAALIRTPSASRPLISRRACIILTSLQEEKTLCERAAFIANGLPKRPYPLPGTQEAFHLARRLLRQPGESFQSSLDAQLQRFAQETLRNHLAELSDRNVEDGAVVILDNKTGEILAYVGSSGSFSDAEQVDGVMAARQPGSTLKPFLYALAIEAGWLTAASILDDTSLALTTPSGLYIPQDYDKHFRGAVSVRAALGSSLNIPAVRTLTLVGVDRFLHFLRDFGFDTLNRDAEHYGYGLALGGAETNLLTLANAYRTFANGGKWTPLSVKPLSVADSATVMPPLNPLLPAALMPQANKQVLSPPTAFIITDILADPAARALTFGLSSPLSTRAWSAVKTGTSKAMRDNWTIGYTTRYTVGVWVGNFSGAPMWDVSGVSGASHIWHDIIEHLHDQSPDQAPSPPPGVVLQPVVFKPAIEAPRKEWMIARPQPAGHLSATVVHPLEATMPVIQPRAHLIAPPDNTMVAPDPDIPARLQSLLVQASSPVPACLFMDKKPLGPCGKLKLLLPLPSPGKHSIELMTPEGLLLDRHSVSVRGLVSYTR